MQIEITKQGNATVVKLLTNRLDARNARAFKEKLREIVQDGSEQIVLNLEQVNFMDSTGLGTVVSGLKLLGNNGSLVISGARPEVLSLFKLTRMDKVFRVVADVEEALSVVDQSV